MVDCGGERVHATVLHDQSMCAVAGGEQGAVRYRAGGLKRTKLAKVRGWLVADPLAEKLLRRAIEDAGRT